MIDSVELTITILHPTSASGIICFIRNKSEISLNLADLVIFSFLADAYTNHICGVCYNGSCTTAAKTLELYYTMIQF